MVDMVGMVDAVGMAAVTAVVVAARAARVVEAVVENAAAVIVGTAVRLTTAALRKQW